MLSDRLCRHSPERKVALAIAYCLGSCLLLSAAISMPRQISISCAGPAGKQVFLHGDIDLIALEPGYRHRDLIAVIGKLHGVEGRPVVRRLCLSRFEQTENPLKTNAGTMKR